VPPTEQIVSTVQECVVRSGLGEAYVRLTVSRGEGPPGVSLGGYRSPVLSVVVRELHGYPAAAYVRGIPSTVVATRKVPPECVDPSLKTGSQVVSVLARRELEGKGLIEGVQLALQGHVVGGTISNVFAIAAGVVRTPDLASGCRAGVTREALLELMRGLGIPVREERLWVSDLTGADEVFFSNTLMECLPVTTIDGARMAAAPGRIAWAAVLRSKTFWN